ncbi:MAG: hypothetical protein KY443_05965 [Actinobacteria bacterium]|nr:hypothetical protein [Actinomycetota bacterium]
MTATAATATATAGPAVRLAERARADRRRVLLVEPDDARVVQAARALGDGGLAVPVLLGRPGLEAPAGIDMVPCDGGPWFEAAVAAETARFPHRPEADVRAALAADPLLVGAVLVRIGAVDVGVAGNLSTTGRVVRAGLDGLGLRPGASVVTSAFLMEIDGRTLTFADCAVVPEPEPEVLAGIAVEAARLHAWLTGEDPRVAMLSFSTHGSSQHAAALRVREAARLAKAADPDLIVDGELQFDAAFVPSVARTKAPGSPVAGQANVFVFPGLDAGNIGYKIAERLAHARAVGPVTSGFAGWWLDLSRGCSAADIVDLCVVGAVLAARTPRPSPRRQA